MALSKIDTPAIADAAVTDAKSAVDLSALATQTNLDAANATIASLRSDIGSLALQSARADNQAAFNLGNSFVDQFEDVTGIDTTSSTQRNASEYVSTTADVADPDTIAIWSPDSSHTSAQEVTNKMGSGAKLIKNADYAENDLVAIGPFSGNYSLIGAGNDNSGWKVVDQTSDFNFASGDNFTLEGWARRFGSISGNHQYIFDWNGNGGASNNRISYAFRTSGDYVGDAFNTSGTSGTTGESYFPLNTWIHWAVTKAGSSLRFHINGTRRIDDTVDAEVSSNGINFQTPDGVLAFNMRNQQDASGSNPFTYVSEIRLSSTARYADPSISVPTEKFSTTVSQVQASGNFTGVTQTAASSVSEMSIVVLYEDNAGTATLNTDITAEVSANNGADWSTVTLAPAGNFSANLKLSKSAPVSVTAGTQPKYRINFANQANGSKVTRIQGVALVY